MATRPFALFAAVLLASTTLMIFLAGSAAAQPTPVPNGTVPHPSECRMAPRPEADVRRLVGTPGPRIEDRASGYVRQGLPLGSPAEAETAAEISAIVHEVFACRNAGDALRVWALFTDAFLYRLGPQEEENFEGLAPPEPVPPEAQVSLVGVWNVLSVPDGQVTAAVGVTNLDDGHPAPGRTYVFLFDRIGDRWFVDELIEQVVVDGSLTYVADIVGTAPPAVSGTPEP